MSNKVEQLCMAGAPTEAVLCALMDESNQLRAELTELNARIDDRNAALLSKTVELAECQKQRDELLAAAKAIEINAEECMDWDECTAMLVPIDDYHKLMEAIATVKEKS